MTISVVMAVHNQLRTLPAALDSILGQTLKDWELILIANGKYIARMDADDEALPSRFTKQVEYLNSHRQVKLLGTAANLIDADGKPLGIKRFASDHEHLRQAILSYCPFVHPTWMVLTESLRELGGYNQDFPFAQDYELALRIAGKYEVANLPEPLLNYRVNDPAAISIYQLKQQEKLALRARFLALTDYGYSWLESWKLVKPLLSYLVPAKIKRKIYQKFSWNLN